MEEGVDIWKITCRVYGGRPKAGISLALPIHQEDERGLWREGGNISDTQASSYHLPAKLYEGQNITCVFDHPMFNHRELRTVTLPAFCKNHYLQHCYLQHCYLQHCYLQHFYLQHCYLQHCYL